ncbi:MAG: RNA-guided endonuclease IscB [Candidatus Desulfaltia sp.]|nr:RNA-guided endonuclease IscB [Candidatus Desulfaltia sp.]
MQVKVFVVDVEGKLCLPTRSARARRLLRNEKAKVFQVVPFTIQLNRVIDDPVGTFTCGVDDGAKKVGVAIINEHTKEVAFQGEIELRQNVSRKLTQRAQYRRTRRTRNLRYRARRFNNRKQMMPAPSVRQRKDSIIRWLKDMMKRINIEKVVIEEGAFDTSSLAAGHKLHGDEFSQTENEGKNFRAKVLWRDKHKCQHCGSEDVLQAHHIRQRKDGGSSRAGNGLTLCEKCHSDLHAGLWQVNIKPKSFRYPAWLMVGKTYLKEQLSLLGLEVKVVYGWMTSSWRKQICLEKSHTNDAISMVCKNYMPQIKSLLWFIKPKRAKIWEDNPTKTCIEKNGFRHMDIVKSKHRTRGIVVGSIRSLKAKVITLRTSFDDNFAVSYNKTKLIQRPNGLVYIW